MRADLGVGEPAGPELDGSAVYDQLVKALLAGPTTGRRAAAALAARLGAGAIFLAFGAAKLTDHVSEVTSFRTYGLPSPDAFVYAIGVIEVGGGALLIAGFATRIASLVLAGDMVGAIAVSGIAHGELISLTLAPALLVVTLFMLWTGPGLHALDRRLASRALGVGATPPER